jgi:PIN domain nuclease of toxin-antitoxin system
LFGEDGAGRVRQAIKDDAAMSAVNMEEVVTRLIDRGSASEAARQQFDDLVIDVVPLDAELAYRAAFLREITRSAGLSVGDRCCIALAEQRGVPALTADRGWGTLRAPISIECIR